MDIVPVNNRPSSCSYPRNSVISDQRKAEMVRNLCEIVEILKDGPATISELAMVCHLLNPAAMRYIKILQESEVVERCYATGVVSGQSRQVPTNQFQLTDKAQRRNIDFERVFWRLMQ